MAQTNVNIRMDSELKKEFEQFCDDVGMSMTTAFCVFAKAAVKQQKIPFEIGSGKPNAETIAALEEFSEMKKHPERYKAYSSFKEALDEVLRDA